MRIDSHGQPILDVDDLFNLYMVDPGRIGLTAYVEQAIEIHSELDLENPPTLIPWTPPSKAVEEFDRENQQNWHMPDEYKNLDIAAWVLDQCQTDEQRQRVGQELLLYLDRDLFPLLQWLKYLVDTMRTNGIVWGVGRGSSVASYVLYLIGVHKIDSIYYDLPITEFLR